MLSNEEIIQEMMQRVSDQLVASLTESFTSTVEKKINRSLSKTLLEGEFYKRVNEDLQEGLVNIYHEVKNAKGNKNGQLLTGENPDELFTKASDQLDAVLKTTEKAAEDIIDIVEKLQEMQASVAKIVKGLESGGITKQDREELTKINGTLGQDLSQIMVTMSFQDLTGQRIKIIIDTIRKVEDIVKQVVMSTGLMIRAREEEPELEFDKIEEETKTKVSKLTGPTADSSQSEVDDLLASMGLD